MDGNMVKINNRTNGALRSAEKGRGNLSIRDKNNKYF